MEKCLFWVTGKEAKDTYRTNQLAGGVDAGIEGGINTIRVLWQEHS